MLKKGVFSLQALIIMIVYFAVTLMVIYALWTIFSPILFPTPTTAERNFSGIISEIEALLTAPAAGAVSVPIATPLTILIVPADSPPPLSVCARKTCICLETAKLTCKPFEDIKPAPTCVGEPCGALLCTEKGIKRFEAQPGQSVRVERQCNTLIVAV